MNENYLHYIWKTKNLPFHIMKLNDGRDFNIIDFGQYNPVESGPDFFNAKIAIDGIMWCGNVEIHIKSSDWYKHKHHKDRAYDNVVLHVVYASDQVVVQNGNTIPEIEIKKFIDSNHYVRFKEHYRLKKTWNCSSMLELVPEVIIRQHLDEYLIRRMMRKADDLNENFSFLKQREVFYFLLAKSFGMKVNQLPFEMLVRMILSSDFSNLEDQEKIIKIQLMSGLFIPESIEEKIVFQNFIRQHECLPFSIWKKGGSRPYNQSKKRVREFAILFKDLVNISDDDWGAIIENNLFERYLLNSNFPVKFRSHILINTVAYFYFWLAQSTFQDHYKEYCLKILESQPSEINRITKFWSSSKIYLRNASQSQAFLEIFGELCSRKLCLNCNIGKYLIER